MNAKADQTAPPDLDQLADQLADHDGTDAEAPDSTLKELKQELDTLAVQVAQPAPEDEFGSESALERGIEFVKEIGRELSATPTTEVHSNQPPAEQLGTIREYRLLAKLGEGGMGAVYKALHTKLDKVVALKILPSDRLNNEAAVSRFEREMKAVGKLEHPNIVAARDAGEIDGTHYLVMELVDGIDLSTLVRRVGPAVSSVGWTSKSDQAKADQDEADGLGSPSYSGAMTIPDACEMIRQAAVGLQEAHEDGMVHRDIKPSNLMLARSRKGRKPPLVKVLDMGLALLDDHRGDRRDLTSTGQMMGTLDYMAPEQGMDSHQVDIRADIYSLGATLFKLLTGQAPFPSSQYDTPVKMMMALATKQAPSIATVRADLPAELAAIVDRMLAKNPDDRFAEPVEVAEALKPFCEACDLALLLKNATAEDAETAEEESKVATHESLKSDSVETARTMDAPVRAAERAASDARKGRPATHPASKKPDPTATTLAKPATAAAPSEQSVPTAKPRRWYTNRRNQVIIAAALGGFVLLSAIIFYIKTDHGTIVVEIDDPSLSVTVQGEDIQITKDDSGEAYKIKPGEQTLHVQRGDLEFDTEKFTLRRGEEVVLAVRLVEGEVRVVQKGEEQAVIGSGQVQNDNYALAFDGESNHVEIPRLKYDATHAITVEAWIGPYAIDNGPFIIKFDGINHVNLFYSTDKVLTFTTFNGNVEQYAKTTPPRVNTRVHVAGTWIPGNSPKLFVDGKASSDFGEYEGPRGGFPGLKSGTFRIGVDNHLKNDDIGLCRYFEGIIDEVRISNIARYDKDFTPAERFEPDEHTLALYHFDEGQGEIAHDSSPNKHHGKIIGAKWVKASSTVARNHQQDSPAPPTTPKPTVNHALAFDGESSHVELPGLDFDASHAITVEATVVPQGPRENHVIHFDGLNRLLLYISRDEYRWKFLTFNGKTAELASSEEPAIFGKRLHVAGVWTPGERPKLFVDGKLSSKVVVGDEKRGRKSGTFRIGTVRNITTDDGELIRHFHGIIDEVRISSVARYDKDFTPAERFEPDEHTLALYHFDEGQGEIAHDSSPNKHHGKIIGAKWVSDDVLTDPDGKIAFWALNYGGTIEVETADGNKKVNSLDELPKGPFEFLKIDLGGSSVAITDSKLDALGFGRLTRLKELNLNRSDVTDASLVHLRDMESLRVLNLQDCPIGDHGLRYLPKSLTGLTLTNTEITDFAARWLSQLTQLEYLDLKSTQLSAEFVAKLKLVLPNCGIASDYPRREIDKLVRELRAQKIDEEDLFAIKPVPVPEIEPGEPLASWALVTRPAKLEGVRSWTIETRSSRSRHRQVLFSGNGERLVVGDWAVKMWRVQDRHLENAIVNSFRRDIYDLPHTPPPYSIMWSPDDSKLAIGASVWDVAQRRRIGVFVAPWQKLTEIYDAAWSPDGELLATSDDQGSVVIWDFARRQIVDKFSVVGMRIAMVRWSQDGKYLAATDRMNARQPPVVIWEFETGNRVDVPELPCHWLEWSPTSNKLAVGADPTMRLFDLTMRQTDWSVEQLPNPIPSWSPDGKHLLTRPGIVLDALTGRVTRDLETTSVPTFFAWSPDGKLIAIGEETGDLDFFRGTSKIPFATTSGILNDSRYVVRWSSDGTEVTPNGLGLKGLDAQAIPSWSSDGGTVVSKGRTNKSLWISTSDAKDWKRITFENAGHFQAKAVSPNGRYVTVAGQSRPTAIVWDTENKEVARELNHDGEVRLVAWSPVGNLIATASYSSPTWLVSLWNGETGDLEENVKVSGARSIRFSPDGKQLAIDTGSSTELWSVATSKMVSKFHRAAGVATPIAWLDESVLAVACTDGVLRVFNTMDSTVIREIKNIATTNAMFSTDGRQYVWSIGGSVARVVDVERGEPLGTLLYLRDEQWLAVSPDGHFKGSEGISDQLIYIVQTDDGVQHTLTPTQFAEQYGWKNDPDKVWLAE